jgi:hypothetical protein
MQQPLFRLGLVVAVWLLPMSVAQSHNEENYFVQAYTRAKAHPCSEGACQGQLRGHSTTPWLHISRTTGSFNVSSRMTSGDPVVSVSYDCATTGRGDILVDYEIAVPEHGKILFEMREVIECENGFLKARLVQYDKVQLTADLSWGLYTENIFVLCYCPPGADCPSLVCNKGNFTKSSAVTVR